MENQVQETCIKICLPSIWQALASTLIQSCNKKTRDKLLDNDLLIIQSERILLMNMSKYFMLLGTEQCC